MKWIAKNLPKVWKATAAFVSTMVTGYVTAQATGNVDAKAWAFIIGSAIVTAIVTYSSPKNANTDNPTQPTNGTTVTKP